jgi:PIN domain nuclease of toxin-antitoxin system
MNLLLDTHIFLWLNQKVENIPANILALCEDSNNTLYLSHVSPWEIQIKNQLGKLDLAVSLQEMIETQQQNGLQLLPISLTHIYALAHVENYHQDPFDRLLIAQATVESMPLITVDNKITRYPIVTISR